MGFDWLSVFNLLKKSNDIVPLVVVHSAFLLHFKQNLYTSFTLGVKIACVNMQATRPCEKRANLCEHQCENNSLE